jgi:N-acetylneuraminate synthase/N,N'-diacetyllegionaminate synthase
MYLDEKKVIIIAEAGVNHNGDLDRAKNLIVAAAKAGADFVKFQTFTAEALVTLNAPKADYQKANMQDDKAFQFGMLKKLEIPKWWYPELLSCCEVNGIQFLSTGFDENSLDFLEKLNPAFYKVPSGEITNKPYLQHVARKGRPIILSTGMAYIEEVRAALEVLFQEGVTKDQLTVLHCNTEYPTPIEDVNLLAMLHIQRELGVQVGYSDHTLGIEVPIAAVALGARVIEKHFTMDRTLAGPDHAASLECDELKTMVESIRNIEKAISGSGMKEPSISEKKNIQIARKSLYYKTTLIRGVRLRQEDIIALRPGSGICPMQIDNVIGKILCKDRFEGQIIELTDFE